MQLRDAILARGVVNDTVYFSRLVSDLLNPKHKSFMPVVSLCIVPYFSLYAHESSRKIEEIDPGMISALSDDNRSIMARSRNILKLFEDRQRGVDGQITYFRDKISSVHTDHFLGNTWLPLARPLEKDLGLFSYEKRLILTTHASDFFMGREPGMVLAQSGEDTRDLYTKYGWYVRELGGQLVEDGQTFVKAINSNGFNRRIDDVRAAKYYGRVFDGTGSPHLNAVLTVFCGLMNFVDVVMTGDTPGGTMEYSVFKIRFVTLHAILRSLARLRDEQSHTLTSRSRSFIEKIAGTAEAAPITDQVTSPFRNTLMHYALDSRVDESRIDPDDPLFGLVPVYFPAHNTTSFAAAVDRCISETASMLEEWAGA